MGGVPGWAGATRMSFNPKGGGIPVAEAIVSTFPHARHIFMYRACHKVAESFAGLLFSDGIPTPMKIIWAVRGVKAMRQAGKDAEKLPLDRLASMVAAIL